MTGVDMHFDAAEQKWSPVIGEFILEFAKIEDYMHYAIEFYIKDTLISYENLNDSLDNRIKLFKKVLERFLETKEDADKLNDAVKILQELKNTRNSIAHNSLCLSCEEDENGKIRLIEFAVENKKNSSSINLATFKEKLIALKKCSADLAVLNMVIHRAEAEKVIKK